MAPSKMTILSLRRFFSAAIRDALRSNFMAPLCVAAKEYRMLPRGKPPASEEAGYSGSLSLAHVL